MNEMKNLDECGEAKDRNHPMENHQQPPDQDAQSPQPPVQLDQASGEASTMEHTTFLAQGGHELGTSNDSPHEELPGSTDPIPLNNCAVDHTALNPHNMQQAGVCNMHPHTAFVTHQQHMLFPQQYGQFPFAYPHQLPTLAGADFGLMRPAVGPIADSNAVARHSSIAPPCEPTADEAQGPSISPVPLSLEDSTPLDVSFGNPVSASAVGGAVPISEQAESSDDLRDANKTPKSSHKRRSEPNASKDNRWMTTLEQLKEYKQEHGDCIVPRGYPPNTRLASWVAEQRKQYKLLQDGKQSSITPERIALLNDMGFAWNAQEAAWERQVRDLRSFKARYGHCHVPLNHEEYPKLGLWVKEQRRHYALMKQKKPSHMTEERSRFLDGMGFCWDTHEASWLERLKQLAMYKEGHGDCLVPANWAENPKLSTWVHHQRRQHKRWLMGKPSHINEERIRTLESMGFCWNAREKGADVVGDDDHDENTISRGPAREPGRHARQLPLQKNVKSAGAEESIAPEDSCHDPIQEDIGLWERSNCKREKEEADEGEEDRKKKPKVTSVSSV